MPTMLDQIEGVFDGFLGQSMTKTVSDLQHLADANPTHPGPHVVMALATSVSRQDLSESKTHVTKAGELLKGAQVAGDPELEFFQAIHDFMTAELRLLEGDEPNARGQAKAALGKMGQAADRAGKPIAQTVFQAARALSQTNPAGQAEHKGAIQQLSRLQGSGKTKDLTDFFLVYAHRKAHDYDQATKVGRQVEGRHPDSALVKRILGSCAFFSQDLDTAERLYREAVAKAPQDPTTHLGLSQVLAKRGKTSEAQKEVQEAKKRDEKGILGAFLR